MSDDIKTLKEEMGKTFESFKETNDKAIEESRKAGEVSTETRAKLDEMNKEMDSLKSQIAEMEKRGQRPGSDSATPEDGQTDEEKELRAKAYDKYVRYGMGESAAVKMTADEKRALAGTADEDGQFLVPDAFESDIIMKAFDLAEVRPLCQVGTTSRDTVKMGSLSKPLVAWGGRGLSVTQQNLATGGVVIPIKNIRALALISNDTLDDAAADVMGELRTAFELAVAEAEDDAFIAGTDQDGPLGIMSNSTVQANYTASGVAAAISNSSNNGIDALKAMMYDLKKTYRRNATWALKVSAS